MRTFFPQFKWPIKEFAVVLLMGMLAACGDQSGNIPSQRWEGIDVHVETRPSPARVGMNEFLIMTSSNRGQPVYNLIVSIRTSDQDPWVQAIGDGQLGVFRRAAEVEPGARSVVQVQIKRDDKEGELRFSLKVGG